MGEFLAAAAVLIKDLTQTIQATKSCTVGLSIVLPIYDLLSSNQTKLLKYFGSESSEFSDTEVLGIISNFLTQFTKVWSSSDNTQFYEQISCQLTIFPSLGFI
jgi:hypothetical protein